MNTGSGEYPADSPFLRKQIPQGANGVGIDYSNTGNAIRTIPRPFTRSSQSGGSGARGPTGPASTVPGPTGPAGPSTPGPTGPTGPTGPASTVPGPVGPAGPTGPASTVPGPTGGAGPVGPTGPKGSFVKTDSGVFELACMEGTRPFFFHVRGVEEAIPPAFLQAITGDLFRFPSHDGKHELCMAVRREFPDWFMPRSNEKQRLHSVKWWGNEYLAPEERGPTS